MLHNSSHFFVQFRLSNRMERILWNQIGLLFLILSARAEDRKINAGMWFHIDRLIFGTKNCHNLWLITFLCRPISWEYYFENFTPILKLHRLGGCFISEILFEFSRFQINPRNFISDLYSKFAHPFRRPRKSSK